MKTVIRENKIPFELAADLFYSTSNIKELERRIKAVDSGKTQLKEHDIIDVEK